MTPGVVAKKKSGSRFLFSCGCRNSKSVSVSGSTSDSSERSPAEPARWPREVSSSSSGDTLTSAVSSSLAGRDRDPEEKSEGTTSFSGLLRELNELEHSVRAWGSGRRLPPAKKEEEEDSRWNRRHRRSISEGRVGESVAVVKETEDPLGDFRQSMLQMIVEKEIVGGPELRDLLRLFLTLNSPSHHGLILRAFAEIWADVFSGYEEALKNLSSIASRTHHLKTEFFVHVVSIDQVSWKIYCENSTDIIIRIYC